MLDPHTVKNAKPKAIEYKLNDGGGLSLVVRPTGFKSWRWRYQVEGREHLIVLGSFPDVSLKGARELRDDARAKVRREAPKVGGGPSLKSEPLETVAKRYLERKATRWSDDHRAVLRKRLEDSVFPILGKVPVRDLQGEQILNVVRAVEDRGSIDVAHRIRGLLENILGFAIGEGLASNNPAAGIKAAMADIPKWNHRPAVETIEDARAVLRRAESIPAHPVIRLCMRFIALTAQRPGECTGARWSELLGVDDKWTAEALWSIPAERMKMRRPHLVPLSRQAVEVIDAVRTYSGGGLHIFPSVRSDREGLSNNALRYLLARAGMTGVQVPHGWRATFSTVMNHAYRADRLVIDLMLAHVAKGEVEAAYNRAEHMERRRELAQIWADMLLEGMPSARSLLELPLAREVVAA